MHMEPVMGHPCIAWWWTWQLWTVLRRVLVMGIDKLTAAHDMVLVLSCPVCPVDACLLNTLALLLAAGFMP